MATNLPGNTARDNHEQQTSFIRKTITFADAGAAVNGLPIGFVPAGALIKSSSVDVSVAFDAATTSVTVGTNATAYDNILTTAQIAQATQGVKRGLPPTVRVDQIVAPTMIYLKTAVTGTPAAGQLTIVIEFVVNRDL